MEKNSKKNRRWSKSTENNGVSTTISVEEVENGFIVTLNKYGHDLKETSKNKYIDIHKRWISKENPLKDDDEIEESLGFDLDEVFKDFK